MASRRPKPSDYGIDMRDPELAQALADLIAKGLIVDSGKRRNGRIVWVALPPAKERNFAFSLAWVRQTRRHSSSATSKGACSGHTPLALPGAWCAALRTCPACPFTP